MIYTYHFSYRAINQKKVGIPMNKKLTTATGQPWADNQNSQTAGTRGPVLMQDYDLLEKLAHFDRERIPERVFMLKVLVLKVFSNLKTTCPNIPKLTSSMVPVKKLQS